MEENKFERQVQQKMDELKIHPSDAVWKNIESRIEKKKRSNRGLIFFLLIFCFFLVGGYLLWDMKPRSTIGADYDEKNNTDKNNSGKATNKITAETNKNHQPSTTPEAGPVNQKNDVVNNASKNKNNNKNSSQQYKLPPAKTIIKIYPGEQGIIVYSKQPVTKQEEKKENSENLNVPPGIMDQTSRITDQTTGMVKQQEISTTNEDVVNKIKDPANNKLNPAFDKLSKDSSSKPSTVQDKKALEKDTAQPKVSFPVTAKHAKKNSWKLGLLFSGGISDVSNGLLNEDKALTVSDPNSTGQFPPGITPQPSATKSGFGFMIGAFVEKNISPKVKLKAGISFKSFTTSNKVGTRNDTTGYYDYRAFYSVSSYNIYAYNTYHNHLNFIELPVTLKVQIGKGKNLPLFWEGGLVVSELITSNALQFNQASGYYYKDNSFFNKTQIGLNTALSVLLFSKQKTSLSIGPYFYYSASGLADKGLYNNKHFVFTGLRTEIVFGK